MPCSCSSNQKTRLVYACSGAANTGYLADQIARKLMREGCADMTCLAALGANLSGFVESARAADENLVIDGCPVACGKRIFDNMKLPYEHRILTQYGVEKGKTVVTGDVIEEVSMRLKESL